MKRRRVRRYTDDELIALSAGGGDDEAKGK